MDLNLLYIYQNDKEFLCHRIRAKPSGKQLLKISELIFRRRDNNFNSLVIIK